MGQETQELQKALNESLDLSQFLQLHKGQMVQPDIGAQIEALRKERKLKKAELARRAGMSEYYLYQILKGHRKPSRDTILCLCLSLSCSETERKMLLEKSGYADLYVRVKRDAIFKYAFQEDWNCQQVNDALYECGEPLVKM